MSVEEFNLSQPFPDIFPPHWNTDLPKRKFMAFRNLEHFKYYVSKLTQKNDDYCGMSYAKALNMLQNGETDFPESEQLSIRNLVRSNLHKRGLITEEVYENYRYSTDGTAVGYDVGKYTAGEPDCVITPSRQYISFFYELYVNISYNCNITDKTIRKNLAKLLATIEELERQHIFIKIFLIFPGRNCGNSGEGRNYFGAIPLFSHRDTKSVSTMSSVLNDRLLRKFFFAILEDTYGKNLSGGYGHAVELKGAMSIHKTFNEIEFFEDIVRKVGA